MSNLKCIGSSEREAMRGITKASSPPYWQRLFVGLPRLCRLASHQLVVDEKLTTYVIGGSGEGWQIWNCFRTDVPAALAVVGGLLCLVLWGAVASHARRRRRSFRQAQRIEAARVQGRSGVPIHGVAAGADLTAASQRDRPKLTTSQQATNAWLRSWVEELVARLRRMRALAGDAEQGGVP